jgi:Leucine-rich repeat (LRR) protein
MERRIVINLPNGESKKVPIDETVLKLTNSQITSLPSEIGKLVNLEKLVVYTNQLTSLPSEIGKLVNLKELWVFDNRLTSLPPEIGKLVNLEKLYVFDNQLTSLPSAIVKLVNLKELQVSSNQLTSLPPEIGKLVNLKELDVSSNQMTSLPSEIGKLVNLEKLVVFKNQLTSLPPEIGELVNLEKLYVSSNQLTSLPSAIGKLVNLKELDVSFNQLTSLPSEIGKLVNLKELVVFKNQLTSLPSEIGKLVNLEKLYVFDNQLTSLLSEIGKLVNLKELRVSRNRLTSLPPEIGKLVNLKEIDVSHNHQLTSLPSAIGKLVNLEKLDVSVNQLTSLPSEIGKLVNLEKLVVFKNQLTSLPSEIGKLVNLEKLDVSVNQLTSLPSAIVKLVNLKELQVSSNQLTFLPHEIGQLVNLTELVVTYNHLTSLPSEIGKLVNLEKLVVSGNQLTSLPSEIGELVNLKVLDVSENQLTSLPSWLMELKELETLDIRQNFIKTVPVALVDRLRYFHYDVAVNIGSFFSEENYPNFLYFGEARERLLAYHQQTIEFGEHIPFLDFSNMTNEQLKGHNWVIVAFTYWAKKLENLPSGLGPKINKPVSYKIFPERQTELEVKDSLEFLAYSLNPNKKYRPLWKRRSGYIHLESLLKNLFENKENIWVLSIVSGFGTPSSSSEKDIIDFLSAAYFLEKDEDFSNDLMRVISFNKTIKAYSSLKLADLYFGYVADLPDSPELISNRYMYIDKIKDNDIKMGLLKTLNFFNPSVKENVSVSPNRNIMPHLFLSCLKNRYFHLVVWVLQPLEKQLAITNLNREEYFDNLIYYLPFIINPRMKSIPLLESLNPKNYGEFLPYSDEDIYHWLNPLDLDIINEEHISSRAKYLKTLSDAATKPQWWVGLSSDGCKNEDNTNLISGDVRGEDEDDPIVSYGTTLYYRCYTLSELTYSFRENTETGAFTWTVPDEPRKQFPRESITQLKEVLNDFGANLEDLLNGDYELEPENVSLNVIELLKKIKQGEKFFKDANAIVATWEHTYSSYEKEDKDDFEKFILWLFILAMDLRFWKGIGHDWPYKYLEDEKQRQEAGGYCTSVEREYQVNVKAEILSDLTKYPNVYDFVKTLPLVDYSIKEKKFSVGQRKILDLFDLALRRNFCLTHLSDLYLNTAMFWIDQIFKWDDEHFTEMLRWMTKNPEQQGFDRTKLSGRTGHVDPIFESQTDDLKDKVHDMVQKFQMTNIIYEKRWNEVTLEEMAGKAILEEELGVD